MANLKVQHSCLTNSSLTSRIKLLTADMSHFSRSHVNGKYTHTDEHAHIQYPAAHWNTEIKLFFQIQVGIHESHHHCIFRPLTQYSVMRSLEPMPGSTGHKAGGILYEMPVHHRVKAYRQSRRQHILPEHSVHAHCVVDNMGDSWVMYLILLEVCTGRYPASLKAMLRIALFTSPGLWWQCVT